MFTGKATGRQLRSRKRRFFWKAATIRGTRDKNRGKNGKPSKKFSANGQVTREQPIRISAGQIRRGPISRQIFCRTSNRRISIKSRSLTASAVREIKNRRADFGLEKNTPIRKPATGRKETGTENIGKKWDADERG